MERAAVELAFVLKCRMVEQEETADIPDRAVVVLEDVQSLVVDHCLLVVPHLYEDDHHRSVDPDHAIDAAGQTAKTDTNILKSPGGLTSEQSDMDNVKRNVIVCK